MAHKKGASSTRNGRDSNAQRLGVKRFGGEVVFVLNLNVPVTAEDPGPSSQWADSNLYE